MRKRKSTWFPKILVLLALGGLSWYSWGEMQVTAITEKYNSSLAALDKVYLGCKVFWNEQGIIKSCTQNVVDSFLGPKEQKVDITVLNGRKTAFKARAQHKESDRVFLVDKKGDIYLNVNGCLAKVRFYQLKPQDLEKLENQCKA